MFYLCLVALGVGHLIFGGFVLVYVITLDFLILKVHTITETLFRIHVFWYLNFIQVWQLVILVMWWGGSFANLLLVCQTWGVWA